MTKEDLDKQLEQFLMKDDEAKERVMKLKREELDSALEKYMSKADDEDPPDADTAAPVAAIEADA